MNQSWWEFQVTGEPSLEELLFWRLQTLGAQGTASQVIGQMVRLTVYVPHPQISEETLTQLAQQLQADALTLGYTSPTVGWQIIHEEDWAQSWKAFWHIQPVGKRLLICPEWQTPPPTDRLVLRLNPGSAFGTGEHATTQLCLLALEAQALTGTILADIGCGSGILSVAALLLGADQVYAVDTDPLAVDAAQAGRDLNGFTPKQMTVAQGSIEQLAQRLPQPVDGFCCNILAEVILRLIPQFHEITQPGSWGILSGLLAAQGAQIADVLQGYGWHVVQEQYLGDWCCLQIQRTDALSQAA
ncbi:50S ribosomal protein L11 methyltransferase [Synechococcales cyanobacterium C]|uniref:Ribosomal protein L11 methyltransferase n=1 Tax=Petrachloros mirabilis ULC683 TaxID=2781853 RepID=A0A8K1ZZJ5_9CYAN|nr:50S ribosomal protein L11 methyltransferase [Petrachloros mirabilis]NCJ06863.1 50S ribosomal protein L11 methyltransferase [Petrachloros mirabilis ULC683]